MSHLDNRLYDHSCDLTHPLSPSTQLQSERVVLQEVLVTFFIFLSCGASGTSRGEIILSCSLYPGKETRHLYGVPDREGCSLARVRLLTLAGVQVRESWGLGISSDLPLRHPRDPRNNQPGLLSWMWTKVLARLVPAFSWNGL